MSIAFLIFIVCLAVIVILWIFLWLLRKFEDDDSIPTEGDKGNQKKASSTRPNEQDQTSLTFDGDSNNLQENFSDDVTEHLTNVDDHFHPENTLNQLISGMVIKYSDIQLDSDQSENLKKTCITIGASLLELDYLLRKNGYKLCRFCLMKVDYLASESCSSCGNPYNY